MLMGTFVDITCVSDSPQQCHAGINNAFQEIQRLEGILSRFKPESDVARLNKASGKTLSVREETFEVIKRARMFYQESGGAFDITVSPLLETWGFYKRDNRALALPAEKISAVLPLIGSDKIIIEEEGKRVGFQISGMAIDLGGIAKGYAVDKARKVLSKGRVSTALINAGGDIYCLGRGRDNQGWKIGIQHPLKPNEIIATLTLQDKAVVTSGQYENFVVIQDERFSHIINPKTGYPVENDILSVTIVAEECLTADALATTVFVLGTREGVEFLRKFHAEGVIISRTAKGLHFLVTEGLKQRIKINH